MAVPVSSNLPLQFEPLKALFRVLGTVNVADPKGERKTQNCGKGSLPLD